MVGLIWFVQVVHYPLKREVGEATFQRYQDAHMQRTSWVVGPPMLIEAFTALALPFVLSSPAAQIAAWVGVVLLAAVWVSTALLQVPAHARLQAGFDLAAHGRLVRGNWFRTAGWTVRSGIAMGLLWTAAFS